jgi:asparagine synthase (glutamine-hydrolysing)
MCGIAGFYSIKNVFSKEDLERMTASLAHRGPENQSLFYEHNVGLGHRRLKIIDLSDDANQPMITQSGNSIIVFNGEIYNYKEIQKQFNISAKTTSDTEILLEAYEKVGPEILNHLNGMFAFAVYDKVKKEIFLARDRMGIKPIYYYWDGENFAFASELKSLLQAKFINETKKINYTTINEYLHLGYVPEPNSIFENIFKFPSGSFASISDEKFQIENYWDLDNQLKSEVITDFNTAKSQLKELVTNSVQHRLISDVPFGTLLSGGVDSSLVTAVAQSVSSEKIKTFSIGFNESKFNEAHHAQKVAKFLETDHHEFIVSHDDAKELIDSVVDSYDEPYADASAIPTMLVSKLARQHVTMTLSGDGGDELFHGYGAYNWAKRLNSPLIKAFRKPTSKALKHLSNKYKRASTLFEYENIETIKSHIFSQEQYFFTRKEIGQLIKPEFQKEILLNEETPLVRNLTPAEKQAVFDLNYYLKDDLLVKVDRASMKYSLENRVPLLDHNIVEFALNLDPELKIKNGVQKFLLKELLYDYVPKEYFDRPKWGFSIPLADWLKTDLKYLIDKYLSKESVEDVGICDYSIINDLKSRYLLQNEDYLYNRLWNLIILHQFLRNISK